MSWLPNPLIAVLVYAPSAFYFYPWKPLLQYAVGDTYHAGYKFFRRDHSDPVNLCLHFVALSWQLCGNFGLLAAIDAAVTSWGRPISCFCAVSWILLLRGSPAPRACTHISTTAIVGAFGIAPFLGAREVEIFMICTLGCVYVGAVLYFPGRRVKSKVSLGSVFLFGLANVVRIGASQYRGVWTAHAGSAYAAIGCLMTLLGLLPKPVVPVVLGGTLVARPLAELTGQEALLFYGGGFMSMAMQGVAHDVSRQKATLLSHEESSEGRRERLAFEVCPAQENCRPHRHHQHTATVPGTSRRPCLSIYF